MKSLTGGSFSKLDDLGMGFGVSSKIRINLESKECLFLLTGAKNSEMDRRSNLVEMVTNAAPKLAKNFTIHFLVSKEQMRYYLNMCIDKEAVAHMITQLYEEGCQFFYCADFYNTLTVGEQQINIPDMITELTSNSKSHYRGKKFIRQLVDEGTLVIPKDKSAMPDKIPLDLKLIQILNNYGSMQPNKKKHRKILLEKATFLKPHGNSKIYANGMGQNRWDLIDADLSNPEFIRQVEGRITAKAVYFAEQLGFKFVENAVYLDLTKNKIFNEIGS